MKYLFLIVIVSMGSIFFSCQEEVNVPKPKGYYRIELPPHNYTLFDTTYPYQFEYASMAVILPDQSENAEPYWANMIYPSLNAVIYISYKPVHHDIETLINDSKTFVSGQIKKADDIVEYHVYDTINKVYGISYDIIGTDVASPYQFWLTDKESHFFRAALYFNHTPNNDSLQPVIQYIKEDILHLINTFKWKNIK
ncbi:MAG: gliding motility lipoprotein GldD [Bacteroidales bacterium]|jgi:gliding motility-associated lipoprotein GldD|nr:gliding motility lipoprotein GldD [Bacteroidales bacterium]